MIRTLFLDFGNVIGFFDHARALRELVRHTDMDPAALELVLYGKTVVDAYESGRVGTPEYVRDALLNGRLNCSPAEFETHFADIFWPNPEVVELVPLLAKRYRLVLASNTCDLHCRRFRELFADTLRHFAAEGTSHDLGARKPQPAFYKKAHALAAAEPGECVFVDDLPKNIEAAERFGWKGVLYRPDGTLPEKLRAAGVEIGKLGV